MKKFITLMLIALVAMFGFVSCTDAQHVIIDNLPEEDTPTIEDTAWSSYKTGISWAEFMINAGTLINGETVKGMTIDPTTVPLTPVITEGATETDPDTAALNLVINFTDFDYDGESGHNTVSGKVTLTYRGIISADKKTITATTLDADFDVVFSVEDQYNTMNTMDLPVTYLGVGNIVNTEGTELSDVSLTITNGVVSKLTGASLTSLTFPGAEVVY